MVLTFIEQTSHKPNSKVKAVFSNHSKKGTFFTKKGTYFVKWEDNNTNIVSKGSEIFINNIPFSKFL